MNFYFLYKSLHLIAVISWMAGLLYLPRIFVYHLRAKSEETLETFKINGETTFLLHNESSNDFIMDFWFFIDSLNWNRKYYNIMVQN